MRKLFSAIISSTLQGGVRGGLLFLALVATTSLWAQTFQVGDLYYNITSGTTVEVTSGDYYDLTTATIPSTVTYNGTTYSVTSIGNDAFYYCSSLTSITIPNSVTSIGNSAFASCSSLTSVTIPNSVKSIGNFAFAGCSKLTKTNYTGDIAGWCNIKFGDNYANPMYYSHNFYINDQEIKDLVIPYSVDTINNYAFSGCSSLTSITIPNSVTSIGVRAFEDCSSLTSVTIPYSVTSIGNNAFSNCSGLTKTNYTGDIAGWCNIQFGNATANPMYYSHNFYINDQEIKDLVIPNSVDTINNYAFYNCYSLTSITIPNSVTSIRNYAFYGCIFVGSNFVNNSTLNAEANNYWGAKVGDTEINDLLIRNDTVIGCRPSATSVTIPSSVTSIGSSAFRDCYSLTSITIPNSVTSIGSSAFNGCSSLTKTNYTGDIAGWCNITFGGTTANPIYYSHNFYINDQEIKDLVIPNSVDTINNYAFYNCDSLTSVTCEAATPPAVTSTFNGVSKSIPVYVPCGCAEAYKAASGWKYFTNIQEPLAEYSIEVNVNDSIMGVAKVNYNTCEGNQISATPNFGYHFVQWSDGSTDTIRTLVLTQDTILTAEFAQLFSGQCGDDLYWSYDETAKTISITGSGNMYDFTADTQPWLLFKEQIVEVTTTNTVTSIGTSAFEGCARLAKISLGTGLEEIAANAFAECKRLYDIYVYATYPPFTDESSFANYNVYVYIPCEYKRDYILDVVWGKFKFIECIDSEEVTTDDVVVTPGTNDVTITWPTEGNADTYTIVIKNGNEVFCTLTFNADGQLLNIAFAPSRDGNNHPARHAEQAANGYRFTVTGLTEATRYAYSVTTKDTAKQTIATYSGEFTTLGGTETAVEDILHGTTNTQKLLIDGQLYILKDGKTYNAMGQEM